MIGIQEQGRWNAFTYGSLMLSFVFQRVTGRSPRSIDARLQHWKRFQVKGESFPAIMPSLGDTVQGILWVGITQEELRKLDDFEGVLYQRVSVDVTDSAGLRYPAEVYRWTKTDGLIDTPWDLDWFKTVGIKDFSAKYL